MAVPSFADWFRKLRRERFGFFIDGYSIPNRPLNFNNHLPIFDFFHAIMIRKKVRAKLHSGSPLGPKPSRESE